LGSSGRKVTLAQTQPDNISLIYPKFNTNITLKALYGNIEKEGDFDIIYDYKHINKIDYYNLNPFVAYQFGLNPVVVIKNNLLQDGKKVLFIRDSFTGVVAPFFSLGLENTEELDLRLFTGSVQTYIEQTKPDMVIVMYTPTEITTPDYTIHTSTFDFR
jgi:hypothetical protein